MSIVLSQTLVKDLERDECCPYKFYQQWIEKNPLLKLSSSDLDKGKFFEQLAIGSGAIQGESVTDLPRLASGKKGVDQIRIEQQADRCERILYDAKDPEYLGFRIINTQLNITKGGRTGTLDIVAHDKQHELWVIDLKLTKDLESDRTKYGWGNDWAQLDLLQQIHYQDLYVDFFGEKPRMGLLVMDYSPLMRVEFGEIIISENKRTSKEVRFKAAEEVVGLYETNGWIKYPSVRECTSCPLECDKRIKASQIVKKVINY